MKPSFLVDTMFTLCISLGVAMGAYFVAIKPQLEAQPKVAVLSLERALQKSDLKPNAENAQRIAKELSLQAKQLADRGYLVVDDASVVATHERFRAN